MIKSIEQISILVIAMRMAFLFYISFVLHKIEFLYLFKVKFYEIFELLNFQDP